MWWSSGADGGERKIEMLVNVSANGWYFGGIPVVLGGVPLTLREAGWLKKEEAPNISTINFYLLFRFTFFYFFTVFY